MDEEKIKAEDAPQDGAGAKETTEAPTEAAPDLNALTAKLDALAAENAALREAQASSQEQGGDILGALETTRQDLQSTRDAKDAAAKEIEALKASLQESQLALKAKDQAVYEAGLISKILDASIPAEKRGEAEISLAGLVAKKGVSLAMAKGVEIQDHANSVRDALKNAAPSLFIKQGPRIPFGQTGQAKQAANDWRSRLSINKGIGR